MIVYFGETVTVEAAGQTWRSEQCEHCGQQFYYSVQATATGSATNPYFLDSSSGERAAAEARAALERALHHGVVPVPCPRCYLYQRDMIPVVREALFPWLWRAGLLLFCLVPPALLIAFIVLGVSNPAPGPGTTAALFGLPTALMCAGIGSLVLRSRRQADYDPNAADRAGFRRQQAAAVALTPEAFARLKIALPAAPSFRERGGQLVNQNCTRCGQRIPDELDSRFCHACGSPVHNRCAAPAGDGCCAACGTPRHV